MIFSDTMVENSIFRIFNHGTAKYMYVYWYFWHSVAPWSEVLYMELSTMVWLFLTIGTFDYSATKTVRKNCDIRQVKAVTHEMPIVPEGSFLLDSWYWKKYLLQIPKRQMLLPYDQRQLMYMQLGVSKDIVPTITNLS